MTRRFIATLLSLLVAACGGGGGSGPDGTGVNCAPVISSTPQALTAAEVERVVAQAIQAAQTVGATGTIAVVDRVGNVLAVYRMNGARDDIDIVSGRQPDTTVRGLDNLNVTGGAALAAIAKAITGAYLSSSGNAFSTRTASLIVQDHFYPGISATTSGPLFGVQFSQLPCGDLVNRVAAGDLTGPKRSPLGLAADPGGFPLYKNGQVVGGVGVIVDGTYSLDPDPTRDDADLRDEIIAQSATANFEAATCIRADRILAGGLALSYSDSTTRMVPVSATTLPAGQGALVTVAGYYPTAAIQAGTAYSDPASGLRRDATAFPDVTALVPVDVGNTIRYPYLNGVSPAPGAGGLTSAEVTRLLREAIGVAGETRAQIRQPLNSAAQVTISVVDSAGNILGVARTADAPLFGTDVSLQKARTAAFFSRTDTAAALPAAYLTAAQTFFGRSDIFANGTAFSTRAIGNIARPYYPDGIETSNTTGPLSVIARFWSPFNDGLQLDYSNDFLNSIAVTNVTSCRNGSTAVRNGMQIFPGGVPLYRNGVLIGAVGVSGDGVDQDDMIASLSIVRAQAALNTGLAHAPAGVRADQLAPQGVNLRYVQCPVSPFLNSSAQNVCGTL